MEARFTDGFETEHLFYRHDEALPSIRNPGFVSVTVYMPDDQVETITDQSLAILSVSQPSTHFPEYPYYYVVRTRGEYPDIVIHHPHFGVLGSHVEEYEDIEDHELPPKQRRLFEPGDFHWGD